MAGLFRNAFFSVAEIVWAGIVLFVLFGYATAYLDVAAIGAWSLVTSTIAISRVADIGVGRALIRFVPAALERESQEKAARLIETAVAVMAGLYLVIAILGEPLFAIVVRASVKSADEAFALSILDYSLVAFWLSNVGGVLLSALAGVHRYDQKSGISMLGSAAQLAATIALVPGEGLVGLVVAQIVQNIVIIAGALFLLRRRLPALSLLPFRFSLSCFREMLSFGASLQAMSIASFFFEPATKLLLSSFSNLTVVGYYDLANRMVTQVRTLLVSAIQVTTPTLAGLGERDKDQALHVYLRTTQSTWALTFPLMAAIAALSPAISELWLGHLSAEFVTFAWILSIAWAINLLCAPAYFMALASGQVHWVVWSYVFISISNLLLGTLLGFFWGGIGVVCGWAFALSAGSLVMLICNDRMFESKLKEVLDLSILRAAAAPGIGALATVAAYDFVRSSFGLVPGIAIALGIMAVATTLGIYRNPHALHLARALRTRLSMAFEQGRSRLSGDSTGPVPPPATPD